MIEAMLEKDYEAHAGSPSYAATGIVDYDD